MIIIVCGRDLPVQSMLITTWHYFLTDRMVFGFTTTYAIDVCHH